MTYTENCWWWSLSNIPLDDPCAAAKIKKKKGLICNQIMGQAAYTCDIGYVMAADGKSCIEGW